VTGLTADDRFYIAEARRLAAPGGTFPDPPPALAQARIALGKLADVAERLDGTEDAGRLAEIRAILAGFDWEHDDRQYALEQIEMIAEGGQP
jgi:hypothetical protein